MAARLLSLALLALTGVALTAAPADWARFRGPNGSGIASTSSPAHAIPASFGPNENVLWKVAMPPGHSSPVIFGKRIYLTAFEGDKLLTLALDRATGKEIWRVQAPRPRQEKVDKRNSSASPSPAVDSTGIYVFFGDFGLIAYTHAGKPRWQFPLGPFNNVYGMGASPVTTRNTIVLICDQSIGSFAIGVDKSTGKQRWRQDRPDALSGHSTPSVTPDGKLVIAPASFRVDAYDADSGEIVWFARGLPSEMKSLPVIDGDTVYINGFSTPENDPGKQVKIPDFPEVIAKLDKNADKNLSKDEADDLAKRYYEFIDLNVDNQVDADEWRKFQAMMSADNALLAFKLGLQGDITTTGLKWKYHRAIPQLPSLLAYQGVLYMVNDGGILTTLDPATGQVHKTARVRNLADRFYASPVAADGKVIFVSLAGRISILKAGPDQELTSKSDLDEEVYATPALVDGKIYLRTTQSLWCFGATPK